MGGCRPQGAAAARAVTTGAPAALAAAGALVGLEDDQLAPDRHGVTGRGGEYSGRPAGTSTAAFLGQYLTMT